VLEETERVSKVRLEAAESCLERISNECKDMKTNRANCFKMVYSYIVCQEVAVGCLVVDAVSVIVLITVTTTTFSYFVNQSTLWICTSLGCVPKETLPQQVFLQAEVLYMKRLCTSARLALYFQLAQTLIKLIFTESDVSELIL